MGAGQQAEANLDEGQQQETSRSTLTTSRSTLTRSASSKDKDDEEGDAPKVDQQEYLDEKRVK